MLNQYNFTGASGTGKTTTLTLLRNKLPEEYICRTGIIRSLAKERDITLNESATEESQSLIFDAYYDFLLKHKDDKYLNDRCLIDPVAYTMYLVANNKLDRRVLDDQWMKLKVTVSREILTHVFYFPINFPLVGDGVRSEDEKYRREIDASIRGILEGLVILYPSKFSYTIIKEGTPEEITKQILNI